MRTRWILVGAAIGMGAARLVSRSADRQERVPESSGGRARCGTCGEEIRPCSVGEWSHVATADAYCYPDELVRLGGYASWAEPVEQPGPQV